MSSKVERCGSPKDLSSCVASVRKSGKKYHYHQNIHQTTINHQTIITNNHENHQHHLHGNHHHQWLLYPVIVWDHCLSAFYLADLSRWQWLGPSHCRYLGRHPRVRRGNGLKPWVSSPMAPKSPVDFLIPPLKLTYPIPAGTFEWMEGIWYGRDIDINLWGDVPS